MKIIVDGFGGDNAPVEILKGCALAATEQGVDIIITGNEEIIRREAKVNNISLERIEIVDCKSVLPVSEDPTQILKKYSDSSMAVGLSLLSKGEGDAFVSAGSTGGLVVGASIIVKRIKGIKRATIATIIPSKGRGYMLIDSGANHECRAEMLAQFAFMGHIYMSTVLNIKNPKVGLLNIGVEENKGAPVYQEAYQLLKKADLNFVGNIEARDLPLNKVDVVVCDGFVGNVVIKYTEGLAKYFMSEIKGIFNTNFLTKIGSALVGSGFKKLKGKMDYTEAGGAILFGVKKPVIKAHGSSNAKAIKNAIKQAKNIAENKTIDKIDSAIQQFTVKNREDNAQLEEIV